MKSLMFKLNNLQPLVIAWEKEKKQLVVKSLCEIEVVIQSLEGVVDLNSFFEERNIVLKDLFAQKL